MRKRALITGLFGQDGSYIAELLHAKGYDIHGVVRQPLSKNSQAIQRHLEKKGISTTIHECDLNSYENVKTLFEALQPHEFYHLAVTHYSSEISAAERSQIDRKVFHDNVVSTLNLLYSICGVSPNTRCVIAGSCLMYDGLLNKFPQNETMPYVTNSIYGLSKVTSANVLTYLRQNFNLHLSVAILYNHESPRRTENFVTKKIVRNLVKIKNNEISIFSIGDLSAVRDWGYAKDYVYGMWLMCQQDQPQDYILATGEGHTIEEFITYAAEILGINWRDVVHTEEGLIGKTIKTILIGDPTLAKTNLKWRYSVSFKELVEVMVVNEIKGELD